MGGLSSGWLAFPRDGWPFPGTAGLSPGWMAAPWGGQPLPGAPRPGGRSRPSPAQALQRSVGAMARGALLGAVACLCFLAPVAEAFKRRGPSVTAKVTLARRWEASVRVGRGPRPRCPAAVAACRGSRPASALAAPQLAPRRAPGTQGLGRAWPNARASAFYGFSWLVGWLLSWFLTPLGLPAFGRRWHIAEFGPAEPPSGLQKCKLLNSSPLQRCCSLCCCQGSLWLLVLPGCPERAGFDCPGARLCHGFYSFLLSAETLEGIQRGATELSGECSISFAGKVGGAGLVQSGEGMTEKGPYQCQ